MRPVRCGTVGGADDATLGVPGVATETVSAGGSDAAVSMGGGAGVSGAGGGADPLVFAACARGVSEMLEAVDMGEAGRSDFVGEAFRSSSRPIADRGGPLTEESGFGRPGVSGSAVAAFDDGGSTTCA